MDKKNIKKLIVIIALILVIMGVYFQVSHLIKYRACLETLGKVSCQKQDKEFGIIRGNDCLCRLNYSVVGLNYYTSCNLNPDEINICKS